MIWQTQLTQASTQIQPGKAGTLDCQDTKSLQLLTPFTNGYTEERAWVILCTDSSFVLSSPLSEVSTPGQSQVHAKYTFLE